jgi:four helix bundle protein
MGRLNTFEELECWKRSRLFNNEIYKITKNNYFKEDYDLRRQIRRASISISSNIAEGFERNTDNEFKHFLYIAKGSAGEVRSQIYLAFDLNYIDKQTYQSLLKNVSTISKIISGLIKYLEKTKIK